MTVWKEELYTAPGNSPQWETPPALQITQTRVAQLDGTCLFEEDGETANFHVEELGLDATLLRTCPDSRGCRNARPPCGRISAAGGDPRSIPG